MAHQFSVDKVRYQMLKGIAFRRPATAKHFCDQCRVTDLSVPTEGKTTPKNNRKIKASERFKSKRREKVYLLFLVVDFT
jgi:hypothetical protein